MMNAGKVKEETGPQLVRVLRNRPGTQPEFDFGRIIIQLRRGV